MTGNTSNRGKIVRSFDIWRAELPLYEKSHVTGGIRPIVVVSNDLSNLHSPTVCVVPITSKQKKLHLPTHVSLLGYGLQHPSQVMCETIMTIDKSCLKKRIGKITDENDRAAIQQAIAVQLNIKTAKKTSWIKRIKLAIKALGA